MCLRNIWMAPYRWKSQIANRIIVKQTIHGYEISNPFIRNGFKNCPAPWDDYGRKILRWTRFGFCENKISLSLRFFREKLTQKKLSNFAKLQFLKDKIGQTRQALHYLSNFNSIIYPNSEWNRILLPKLFWPTVRKKCSKGQDNFRMNLWSHRFSQNTNEKLLRFLPCTVRAEILFVSCSYFGRNDDFISSFWK